MGANSHISWTHHTFNPWIGCSKVSEACKFCYAEYSTPARVHRAAGVETWGPDSARKDLSIQYWKTPHKWNRKAMRDKTAGYRVFCGSLCDVFEDREDLEGKRADLFRLVKATPFLLWLLLTKRTENVLGMIPQAWKGEFPRNVVTGATVENQARANERIPELLQVPGRHFLSMEPLVGPIDLSEWTRKPATPAYQMLSRHYVANGGFDSNGGQASADTMPNRKSGIDWIIVGGESIHHGEISQARPMHPWWAKSLRLQAQASDIGFHVKQWGEWMPVETPRADFSGNRIIMDISGAQRPATWDQVMMSAGDDQAYELRGVAQAGRQLDGEEYNDVLRHQPIEL